MKNIYHYLDKQECFNMVEPLFYLIASNIQSKVGSTMIKLILQLSDENILIGIMPLEGFLIYRSFYLKHD